MKKQLFLTLVIALGFPVRQAAHAQGKTPKDFVAPVVFQAAGPNIASIQGTVVAFRTAVSGDMDINNGNGPGPLPSGRREINWDGGGNNVTTDTPVTPFNVFLNTRG